MLLFFSVLATSHAGEGDPFLAEIIPQSRFFLAQPTKKKPPGAIVVKSKYANIYMQSKMKLNYSTKLKEPHLLRLHPFLFCFVIVLRNNK